MVISGSGSADQDLYGIDYINSYSQSVNPYAYLHCEYTKNCGRVMRSTCKRQVGEVIFIEKPLHVVAEQVDHPVWQALVQLNDEEELNYEIVWYWFAINSLVESELPDGGLDGLKVLTADEQFRLLLLFAPDKEEAGASCSRIQKRLQLKIPAVKLERLLEVWVHNCFEYSDSPRAYGTFFQPSFCSHSCEPNAIWHFKNGQFVLRARRVIEPGEEVCITYLSEDDLMQGIYIRRNALELTKHFVCQCSRCVPDFDPCRGLTCPMCHMGVVYMESMLTPECNKLPETAVQQTCGCKLSPASVQRCLEEEKRVSARVDDIEKQLGTASFVEVYEANSAFIHQVIQMKNHWLADKLAILVGPHLRQQVVQGAEEFFQLACVFHSTRIEYLTRVYPSINGALAWCYEELADLIVEMHKQQPSVSIANVREYYTKALTILELLFGTDHEYFTEPQKKLESFMQTYA